MHAPADPFAFSLPRRREWLPVVTFTVAYFAAHFIAFFFPDTKSILMAIWPAGGIGLAALLISPRRLWPVLLGAFFVAGNTANFIQGRSMLASAGFMTANILESLGSACLIRYLCGGKIGFSRVKEVNALILAVVFVNAGTAFIGAGTASLTTGALFWPFWRTWWIADGLGMLLVMPLIVSWRQLLVVRPPVRWSWVGEGLLFFLLWIGSVILAFDIHPFTSFNLHIHFPYFLFALLAWPALRFGQPMVTLALVLLSALALTSEAVLSGPLLWGGGTQEARMLLVELFIGTIAATQMLLAANHTEVAAARARAEKAEEEATEEKNKLVRIADNLPGGTVCQVVLEPDGELRFLYVSGAVERINGVTVKEVLENPEVFFGQIVEEDRPRFTREKDESARTMSTFDVIVRLRRPDGALRWMHIVSEPRALEDGRVLWDGLQMDITERKKAEETIRKNEKLLRGLLDSVDEGFIVIDRDYRILTANRAYCQNTGVSPEEIAGKTCYKISHHREEHCAGRHEACAASQVFADGSPHVSTHRHIDPEGRILHVETKAFPLEVVEGSVLSVIEVVNDISERRQLEEERLKVQKLEAVGTLAGGIAHDFNNLLQGVFGYLSMARDALDEKTACADYLEQAEKALQLSVNLTTQLLTFAKGGRPVRKRLDLAPVIENGVAFALSGSSIRSDIRLGAPLWTVEVDEGQISQVIQNIVINAVQAMPGGGTIAVRALNVQAPSEGIPASLAPGKYVQISLQDSGTGIPPEVLGQIFDPYFTTKTEGNGLGLATTYSIIKHHGSTIDVKSWPGKGTIFTFWLPAVEATDGPAAPRPSTPVLPTKPCRILIMDDEEMVRDLGTKMVSRLGHEPTCARNGEEAIALYRRALDEGRKFDLVILDLTIRGGMGGKDAIRKLRALDPEVTAVVSSGYADDSGLADFSDLGFDASLSKPYNLKALRDIFHFLLPPE